ncbi:hypothetical protein C5167_050220 [Papaver somniferum]|uniref:Uncharacterized protein n=1 Tax=Papaver somniferum TaxID=3469 RepID=A0A4Y7KQX2_PAPSO|nr:hypothetical protein C5167_050220 [Papaver somniferum]
MYPFHLQIDHAIVIDKTYLRSFQLLPGMFSVRSFLKLALIFCLRILDSTNNSNTSTKSATGDETCDDYQVSVVFDPSEVPSFDDLEEDQEEEENKGDDECEESSSIYDHDHDHCEKKKRRKSIDSNRSLNVQPMKSFNPFDDGTFSQILTFWKKKEGQRV